MKRPFRGNDGMYLIHGKKYKELFGSREQVYNETAYKTLGKLTKSQLYYNTKSHRILSLSKHNSAKKELRLHKYGYFSKKGKFGYVKKNKTRKIKRAK